jgi:hypothetical protein
MIAGGLRVLAISDDSPLLRACRLGLPLFELKTSGLIESYFISGSSLIEVPSESSFDVLWLQRCNNAGLVERLSTRLDGRYLLDIDDYLLGGAAYLPEHRLSGRGAVARAVCECAALTTPSLRLVAILEDATRCELRSKTVVCPNALTAPACMRTPERPAGMLMTQSDRMALTRSQTAVLSAVCTVAQRHELPITYVGVPSAELARLAEHHGSRLVALGHLDYWHYHTRLTTWPTLLGICPLETQADDETLKFIRGKSDMKMVEFAGRGHPAVYSRAEPYVDTDLRAGLLADNDERAWVEALEHVLASGWRAAADEQAQVCDRRAADRVARECWLPALHQARLKAPLSGEELRRALGSVGRPLQAFIEVAAQADRVLQGRVAWRLEQVLRGLARAGDEC